MSDKEIIVVGYVKSGNTWLSRLLGDVLNSPVVGIRKAVPIAQEGVNRLGEYTVRQLHLRTNYSDNYSEAIPVPSIFSVPNWDGHKIVHIYRDPRAVAVSIKHYWQLPTLEKAIEAMHGNKPLGGIGRWDTYVSDWLECTQVSVAHISYCQLHADTAGTIGKLLSSWGIEVCVNRLAAAITRQSFDAKKRHIESSADGDYPYGSTIQSMNLRKGDPDDWKNGHYSQKLLSEVNDEWRTMIEKLGFEL